MRVASAVVGGLGALLGVVKGLLSALVPIVLLVSEVLSGYGWSNSYLLLWIWTEVGTAISCALGIAGAGLVLSATRLRVAALLMLVGAAGVAIFIAAYVAVLPRIVIPVEAVYPSAGYFALSLSPVLALLLGAALALLAYRRVPA